MSDPTRETMQGRLPALRFMPKAEGDHLDSAELQFAELLLALEDGLTEYTRNGGDFAPTGALRRLLLEAFRGEHHAASPASARTLTDASAAPDDPLGFDGTEDGDARTVNRTAPHDAAPDATSDDLDTIEARINQLVKDEDIENAANALDGIARDLLASLRAARRVSEGASAPTGRSETSPPLATASSMTMSAGASFARDVCPTCGGDVDNAGKETSTDLIGELLEALPPEGASDEPSAAVTDDAAPPFSLGGQAFVDRVTNDATLDEPSIIGAPRAEPTQFITNEEDRKQLGAIADYLSDRVCDGLDEVLESWPPLIRALAASRLAAPAPSGTPPFWTRVAHATAVFNGASNLRIGQEDRVEQAMAEVFRDLEKSAPSRVGTLTAEEVEGLLDAAGLLDEHLYTGGELLRALAARYSGDAT